MRIKMAYVWNQGKYLVSFRLTTAVLFCFLFDLKVDPWIPCQSSKTRSSLRRHAPRDGNKLALTLAVLENLQSLVFAHGHDDQERLVKFLQPQVSV